MPARIPHMEEPFWHCPMWNYCWRDGRSCFGQCNGPQCSRVMLPWSPQGAWLFLPKVRCYPRSHWFLLPRYNLIITYYPLWYLYNLPDCGAIIKEEFAEKSSHLEILGQTYAPPDPFNSLFECQAAASSLPFPSLPSSPPHIAILVHCQYC